MKAVSENVYARGKRGNLYVRRRIPAALRAAYPARQEHIVRCLGTADVRAAKPLARAENTRIDTEFRQKRQELDLNRASLAAKRISTLDDEQLQTVAKFWVRQVLTNDQQGRQEGLDDAPSSMHLANSSPRSGPNSAACWRRERRASAARYVDRTPR